jgi:hypothetical protein
VDLLTLKMKALPSLETSVTGYQSARRKNPEDMDLFTSYLPPYYFMRVHCREILN